jgi:hypothetical protein
MQKAAPYKKMLIIAAKTLKNKRDKNYEKNICKKKVLR